MDKILKRSEQIQNLISTVSQMTSGMNNIYDVIADEAEKLKAQEPSEEINEQV